MERIAAAVNILGRFCGRRDVPALTADALRSFCGIEQADVMALFGASIMCGGDVLAKAMQDKIAKKFIIVGGEGHTTPNLRERVHALYPHIDTENMPEAHVFAHYLKERYDLEADFLETESTNCGNDITNMLEVLGNNGVAFSSIILSQDATLQLRMDAGLRKYAPELSIINYAVYDAEVIVRDGRLAYAREIWGMWEIERYISLLMGEIPRLTDDADGYGPAGKGFIAHVDVPGEVKAACELLLEKYPQLVRGANPYYASK